ncbi:hypothetical protein [Lichenifustis flavocetrariae]|uniref:Uncharacterized protein n=1 Tax=Lichenifustis flavocetrariae TaxID=2949735 RepID=A0AA41Z7Q2_9HYPH|nr:hypothetical protein [Lichenifustis flavocetrariae]MCW6510797.1 hypothetical protein [Lichenifustis flavocetrariae]
MKWIALIAVALMAVSPALARSRVVKHPSRGALYGTPIIAGSSAVRVSPDGLVISEPVPIIQKEKNFNSTIKRGAAPTKTNGNVQP